MTRQLNCRDVGFDCAAVVRADTDEEVMAQAAGHVREVHGLADIDDDTVQRIRSQIRDS